MLNRSIILLALAFLLSAGCSTTEEKTEAHAAGKGDRGKKFMPDAVVIYDLQEVDLDRDGIKEIVAVYMIDPYSTGVKVFRAEEGQKEKIIFKEVYKSSEVKFKIEKDSAMLVVRPDVKLRSTGDDTLLVVKDKKSACPAVKQKLYRWDGSAFVAVK